MFTPYTLRGVTLKNRIVVSPMAQYSAVDGVPGDYHLVHLGARAMGGAALVFVEMTCVPARKAASPPAALGCGTTQQAHAFKRIVDFRAPAATPRSACSSATAAPRARRSVGWEALTSRCPQATGR
jgi:anthraniloyl-CoA monooxygenase